jgi:HlyD family secretion protein
MFTIVRDNAMELRAEVSERDLLRLAPGQKATLVASEGGTPVTGTVRRVEPTIDPQTRLGTARIAIDDPTKVVQGMFLTAEVTVRQEDELVVPVTAVGSTAEGTTVMRVRDGIVQRVPVSTGIRDGGLIGISEGLQPGDLVVTKAAAFVRDGDKINPVPGTAPETPPTDVAAAEAADSTPAPQE